MVAQRAGVLAQIALAELHLEFTEVRAPFNGVVVALKTTVGQYASALKPVFTLLDDDRWYVIANFRETDLNNVRPGVAARITVMTNHNRTFNGVVDSVGSGVLPEGGSVIEGLPLIQKSINWVHVSQRFPVKIAVSDPDPALFRMGASASAVANSRACASRASTSAGTPGTGPKTPLSARSSTRPSARRPSCV